MRKLLLILGLFIPVLSYGQGVFIPPRTVTGTVNGITRPIASATVTVCAANTSGTPCSPALTNTVFKDSALTVPLSNPFTTDANGNYPQAALGAGIYTISESAAGFTGFSYQITVNCAPGPCAVSSITTTGNASIGGTLAVTGTSTLTGALTASLKQMNTQVVVADQFAGADCGAKINAADAFLGANAGVIWDFPQNCGAVTTPVFISSNHYLIQFAGSQNWGSTAAPVGSGNGSLNFISVQNAGFTCQPGCIMFNTQSGYTGSDNSRDLIFVDSGNPICSTTLNANANEGTTTLTTVATPTGCAIGQDINIEDTRFSEVNRICNVVGSTITLCGPLENSYTTARTAGINVYNWAKNIFIDGVNIQGNNGSGSGIYLQSTLDFKVSNLNVKGISGRCFLAGRFSSRGFFSGANCDGYLTSLTGVPGAEYYIWTQHLNASNIVIHDYVSHGWVLHGFHKQISGFNLYRNGLSGLSCDSGAKMEISNGNSNSNLGNGFNIGGGALNTTECTEVTITNVTATDNLGDGLHAGDGGNVTLNVTGSQFLRNQGTNGGAYYNAVQPGSQFSNNSDYGNTNNGFVIDGSTTGIQVNNNNFKFPSNSAANGGNDIKILSTGSLASSNMQWNLYGAGTGFNNAGTFDATSINYSSGTGSQGIGFQNNGATTTYNGGHIGGLNAINYADNAAPLFCAASQTSTGADTADGFWKYCFNNAAEQHVPQSLALTSQYTNSTTGFTNVAGGNTIQWSVAANKNYTASCHLYYQAAATGGLNIEFTGPASPTAVHYGLLLPVTTGTAPISTEADAFSTSLGAVVGTATTNFDAIVSFQLVNGANAGTVNLLAKSSAAVQLQIQAGSYCIVQ